DGHIWAQSYTRTLTNIFGVEGEVAQKVAAALDASLTAAEHAQLASVPSANEAAMDLFLRAEYQLTQGEANFDTASWKAAMLLYRQAVGKDPNFAPAWAHLSYTESSLAFFGGGGDDVTLLKRHARSDAREALKLQSDLPAAQLAIGYADYWGDRNYKSALKAFAAVLVRHPDNADALAGQSYVQRRQGRLTDSIASMQKAFASDPRNDDLATQEGYTWMMLRRYASAERWFGRALAINPHSVNAQAHRVSAIVYGTGDIPRALASIHGDAPRLKQQRVRLLTLQRNYRAAIALLESIPDTPNNFLPGSSRTLQLAILHGRAGDMMQAARLFAQARTQRHAKVDQTHGYIQEVVLNAAAIAELGIGHTAEGLATIAKSEATVARTPDPVSGPGYRVADAKAYAMAGRGDLAASLLGKVLSASGSGQAYAPLMLWLDPAWDPIRHDPRFQALQKKYAKDKPALIPAIPASAPRGPAP
ncbi:MAG: tetratricopeptide repeat protein, partial [Rhodanobacteraceae bacterium]